MDHCSKIKLNILMEKLFSKPFFLIKLFFLVIILFSISSCHPRVASIFPNIADKEMKGDLRNSSPDFIRGWKDGCETGSSSGSNTFYKFFFRNTAIDGFKFSGNPDYRDAWTNSFWYCYRNMWVRHKSSIYSSVFGGYR